MTAQGTATLTLTADAGTSADTGSAGDEGRLIVHGQDRPGVVAGVSAALTAAGANIARMWLLNVNCRIHLAARAAGTTGDLSALTAEEIVSRRDAAPPLLDRLWTHLRRVGTAGPINHERK